MIPITFKEQFDKLTRAYINEEVNPFLSCNCFVGNLLNRSSTWSHLRVFKWGGQGRPLNAVELLLARIEGDLDRGLASLMEEGRGLYGVEDVIHLENTFIKTIQQHTLQMEYGRTFLYDAIVEHPNYEEALFQGFVATLEELRKIHESRGEKVDDYQFIKREIHEKANLQGAV